MTVDWKRLRRPFEPDQVEWRIGSDNRKKQQDGVATKGQALAYIDARDVMDRLDECLGPEGWQCRYTSTGEKTVCEIGIRVAPAAYMYDEGDIVSAKTLLDDGWVWKADGAGASQFEAEKGALSDAFKRAAVRWGIGRYLYHLEAPWVELEKGRWIAKHEISKLRMMLRDTGGGAKDSFHGPLGKTELKAQARQLAKDIDACEDLAQLSGVTDGYGDVIQQLQRDLPDWWYGVTENGMLTRPGAMQRIEEKREALMAAEEAADKQLDRVITS